MLTRRAFLAAAPLCAAGISTAAESILIVDTHLHCFAGKDNARYPYHANAPYRPAEAATPEHLLQCMTDGGVDRAIVVHPEPYQDDHRYLEHCLSVGKGRLKGTCLFFAERDDSIQRMKDLAKRLPLVSARIHAYNPERLPPFDKPEFKSFWKAIGELGLTVQIHFEPRHAPGFEPLIRDFPDIPVLVDHLGRPFQGTEQEYAVVLGWSKYKNVIVKLSSVPERGKYPHRDPSKVIRQLTDGFGPDRLMYGGGFEAKATGASYGSERKRIGEFLVHLSEADRAKIFGGVAARVFKLK